jgi:hypothetical protein
MVHLLTKALVRRARCNAVGVWQTLRQAQLEATVGMSEAVHLHTTITPRCDRSRPGARGAFEADP